MKICYVCRISMQKQLIVKDDVVTACNYICPACKIIEEDLDVSGSKYSAFSSIEDLKEV